MLPDNAQNISQYIDKLRTWCSRSEKCAYDVSQWCKRKEIDKPLVATLVHQLVAEGFVNHERYARAFVNDKLKLSGWGSGKIRYALKARQLEDDIIRAALDGADNQAEEHALQRLIEKKARQIKQKHSDSYLIKQKLLQFCLSRGYSYDMASKAIEGWRTSGADG